MAASMSLQQPSRTHLFRSHISYPDDIYSTAPPSKRRDDRPAQGSPRSRRDDGLRSHRQYPVQQQGSDDRDRNAGSDYIDHDRQQARADRPLPLHPAHAVPRQLGPPPSRAYEESRVQVSNLITTPTSSTGPMLPRGSPTNRSSSPADALSNSGHLPRLPSVDQLLAGHASDATERERPEPSGAPQFVEPQYHRANQDLPGLTTNHGRPAGHSAGSSLSSMYSEPTSPRSYNGHSYSSPSPHQRYAPAHHDVRGQAPSYLRHDQYPPPQRDDMAQVYHQRSQPNIYPSTGGHPPPAAYTPYAPPIQAPYAPQHQAHYQTQYQTPYRTPHPRSSMDLYGQMPRPDPPAQRPLPDYAPPGPNAYPQGSSGHLSDLRNDSVMGSAYPVYNYPSHSYPPPRKRRGNLPKDATKIMKEWFAAHKDSPYPSEEQKQMLVSQTRLCMNQETKCAQVNNWFINARRRQPRREAESIFERERERERERGVTENSEDSLGNEVANEHDWPRQRMPQTHNHGPPPAPLPFHSRQEHPSNREQEEDERNLRSNRRPGPSPPPGPPHT